MGGLPYELFGDAAPRLSIAPLTPFLCTNSAEKGQVSCDTWPFLFRRPVRLAAEDPGFSHQGEGFDSPTGYS